MSTPLTDSIQNLIDYINEVTGGEDTTLSDAIRTLTDGYYHLPTDKTLISKQEFDAASNVVVPMSISWLDEYSSIIIEPNITLSENDWLYIKCVGFTNIYMQGTTFNQPKMLFTKNDDYRWIGLLVKDNAMKPSLLKTSNNVNVFESGCQYYPYKDTVSLNGDVSVYGSNLNLNTYLDLTSYIING